MCGPAWQEVTEWNAQWGPCSPRLASWADSDAIWWAVKNVNIRKSINGFFLKKAQGFVTLHHSGATRAPNVKWKGAERVWNQFSMESDFLFICNRVAGRHSCSENETRFPKEQNLYVWSHSCQEEIESELVINKLSSPTGDTCEEYWQGRLLVQKDGKWNRGRGSLSILGGSPGWNQHFSRRLLGLVSFMFLNEKLTMH